MATSLAKLKSQIEKLQKQAATIQSTVIARIKREIEQHGLSVDDLFGSESSAPAVGHGPRPAGKSSAAPKKAGAARPAKFADEHGNTWHGRGLRPKWVHEALGAGRKLEEFLIGANSKPVAPGAKAAPKNVKAGASSKTASPKKAAAVKKLSAKKAVEAPAAKKARNVAAAPVKVAKARQVATKSPSKKAAAKKSARVASQPASVPAADATSPRA